MGVDMVIEGRYGPKGFFARPARPDEFLASVGQFIESTCPGMVMGSGGGPDGKGSHVLAVALHPAEQPAEFRVPKAGTIVCDARTSNAGPGYHQFLCELLDRMSPALQIEWDRAKAASGDETGYFAHRDRARLEQAMLAFLQALAKQVSSQMGDDVASMSIGLGVEHQYDTGNRAATAMGPRTAEWFRAVARDPRPGVSHFAWWQPGLGAQYHLGRALTLMWTEVRWRAPDGEAEVKLDHHVLTALESAHRLDPALPYPWREWNELATLARHESPLNAEVARRAAADDQGELIGYRRKDVTVMLQGGWHFKIPGSFAEEADESGTWSGGDETRSINFSTITVERRDGRPAPPEEMLQTSLSESGSLIERYEHRGERVVGKASLADIGTPEEPMLQLSGMTAIPNTVAIMTITFERKEDCDWAVETWRSIDVPAR
jgi:hypothetical protein